MVYEYNLYFWNPTPMASSFIPTFSGQLVQQFLAKLKSNLRFDRYFYLLLLVECSHVFTFSYLCLCSLVFPSLAFLSAANFLNCFVHNALGVAKHL